MLMLVPTYLSLDGNLPLPLQPGAFQLVREVEMEREREKSSRSRFVSISADKTTQAHFPEAMMICKAVLLHLVSCNFENQWPQ